jgi:general secretion pathway protein G
MNRIARTRGFTLVEILIVVIILGILAAIVIPQFSNASSDARRSSLSGQLQTMRSQIGLYALQHGDQYSPKLVAGGATAWDDMVIKTNADHTAGGNFGPYLQGPPANNLNADSSVTVVSGTTDYSTGGVAAPASAGGWVFNSTTGKVWATSEKKGFIYNEANPNDPNNKN